MICKIALAIRLSCMSGNNRMPTSFIYNEYFIGSAGHDILAKFPRKKKTEKQV